MKPLSAAAVIALLTGGTLKGQDLNPIHHFTGTSVASTLEQAGTADYQRPKGTTGGRSQSTTQLPPSREMGR